jgi:hypothetical protein
MWRGTPNVSMIFRMILAGHVACIPETRNVFKILVRIYERKRPFGRPRYRWRTPKQILMKYVKGVVWIIGLKTGSSGGMLRIQQCTFPFHKSREFLDKISGYSLLKKGSTPRIYSVSQLVCQLLALKLINSHFAFRLPIFFTQLYYNSDQYICTLPASSYIRFLLERESALNCGMSLSYSCM